MSLVLSGPMLHPSTKLREKQVSRFFCNLADKLTNWTENMTSLAEVIQGKVTNSKKRLSELFKKKQQTKDT